ncbi:trace amine-associated receptor 1-like [Synchiropus splendidus]|uniref:trace amine-associated receptor 1-like n=1 Tax=Synchiropus splendidus TaxID=270530 RepID=UPI00237D9DB7|nr:trace amine-associated receptor 1-like [Synchiropus splendidus]
MDSLCLSPLSIPDLMDASNRTGARHCSGFSDDHIQAFLCFLFYFFLSAFSIVTVCGNLLVLVSVTYFRQLHTPTNFLVLSLAMCDLLVGAVVFPLSMKSSESSCRRLYDSLCRVRGILDVSLCSCSILNLSCISIDRYYAVCHPLTYKSKINSHVVAGMILLIWTVSAMIGISFLFAHSHRAVCGEPCLIANAAGLLFSFYLPVLTILLIYLRIFLVAHQQARSIQKVTNASRMERRATRTLVIVMGVFLACWLPFFLCTTVRSFSNILLPSSFVETLNWLALSNSMLNPFIYAFFYSWFRAAFKIIISGKIICGSFKNSMLQ